jgi:hypothetical protein
MKSIQIGTELEEWKELALDVIAKHSTLHGKSVGRLTLVGD